MTHPQIRNLERVATVLAAVPERFVFTGGATICLYVDEILQDELRPTLDVDCVVEIFSRSEYYTLMERLREVGLEECTEPNAPLCRWQYQDLIIDIMPCEPGVLGFSNRWYGEGIKNAIAYNLPSGQVIDIFSPVYLLASKVEAFLGRGKDLRLSKDVEDIVILLDGCEVLEAEFNRTRGEVKDFLGSWFRENRENLQEAVLSFLPTSSVDREDLVIDLIERFGQVI
ncbi:nucleotidyl transferase AbiEii/AbiGii toxin family protein [Planktothrix agardhii]|nr:nucleotidyl transferase AbiEii/AbiGii toxin family protein [Planktothrix agardhii]MCB8788916.1 nucleotidyl transferase AbiEii/AbiGii toxin family protein [Planktothrix agardhii 1025]MCF3614236.1 nucleotidyl transferase AbiEii/AbiGii toxin family protein [Planktothrix agardhii 1027]MCF3647835.1 nucleotidyl transferase AbiEii/AbiGii toxin family protein [Planktothrix agardhii 1026]